MLSQLYLEFLKVKPGVIQEFAEKEILYKIGLRIIKSLNQKRHPTKENRQGYKSELLERDHKKLNGYLLNTLQQNDNPIEIKRVYEKIERDFEKMNSAIIDLLNDPKHTANVSIFLQVQESNVYQVSKESGISRFILTKACKEAQTQLQNKIR